MEGYLRVEKLGGDEEKYFRSYSNKLLSNISAQDLGLSTEEWGITHLQWQSKFGFLYLYPAHFCFWWYWKPKISGVPGSEYGLFFSIGKGRWDAGMQKYIIPRFYLGMHND